MTKTLDSVFCHTRSLRRSAANFVIASENSPLRNSPRVLSAKRFDRVEKMKRTVKLSLGFCIAMLTIALAAPHLSSPKLVLRFLPKDVYEAGKDHPAPSLPKRLLGHLLLVITAAYAVWAYRDISDGIRREKVSFKEAYKRLLAFLMIEKVFDITCLDQILCMSSGYYQRFYPETKECAGWKDRAWNNKNQAARIILYPLLCAVQTFLITERREGS